MRLTTLVARDFRNLAALDLELPAEGMIILGENGHGKTNLFEAIYYLVLFRSFRGAKDRELVRFGADGFFLAGTTPQHRVTAGYAIAGRQKKVTVDGTQVARLGDAVGTLSAVAFAPADRAIVAGGPAARRRYLDIVLSLSEPGYLSALVAFRGALRQRNAALRRGRTDAAQAFDAALAGAAHRVSAARMAWVERWRERFREFCAALGEPAPMEMAYLPYRGTVYEDAAQLCRALAAALDRDLHRGMTTVGPHRDDLGIHLDGRQLRVYGSAGQQRTAAIALRLVEAASLKHALGSPPVALYDDVFAELDAGRQARLLGLIRDTLPGQALVAAPRESEVPAALLDRPRRRMECGTLVG